MNKTATCLESRPQNHSLFTLSVSKLKTFKDCKAKYRFGYIEKLPRKERDYHVFGKFLHQILESFHKARLEGNVSSNSDLMDETYKNCLSNWNSKLNESQITECKSIISEYLQILNEKTKKYSDSNILQVEKEFYIDIGGKVLLNGFIDLVQEDVDSVIHVADYKTTKNKKYVKNDFLQLKTYAYVLCLEDPSIEKVRASYIMLRHGFEYITKEFTRKAVMETEDLFVDYYSKINEEELWRPNPTPLCGYCDYLQSCSVGKAFINERNGFDKFGSTNW